MTDTRCKVKIGDLCENLSWLKMNPFKLRLCWVFGQEENDFLKFEEFLDMMSVLSEAAPIEVKFDDCACAHCPLNSLTQLDFS